MNRIALSVCLSLSLAAPLAAGCLPGDDSTETPATVVEEPAESFAATYISGHLGSYWDCPGDALGGDSAAAAKAEPAGDMAACAEGEDCGGWIMNCEHGEATLRLTNTGEASIVGIELTDLELIIAGGVSDADVVTTELVELIRADGQALGAELAAGASVDVVVRFKGFGPNSSQSDRLRAPSGSGVQLRAIFATEKSSADITTPELQSLPMVAT